MKLFRILVLLLVINTAHMQAMKFGSRQEEKAIQAVATCLVLAIYFPGAAKTIADTTARYASKTIVSSVSLVSEWLTPALVFSDRTAIKKQEDRDFRPDTELFIFPWGGTN